MNHKKNVLNYVHLRCTHTFYDTRILLQLQRGRLFLQQIDFYLSLIVYYFLEFKIIICYFRIHDVYLAFLALSTLLKTLQVT